MLTAITILSIRKNLNVERLFSVCYLIQRMVFPLIKSTLKFHIIA